MRDESLCLALSKEKRRYLLLVSALSLLCLSQAALAQSGRRQVKRESPSPPPGTTEAKRETVAQPTPAKTAPAASFIISGDKLSAQLDLPAGYLDVAVQACIDRLAKAPSVAASAGGTTISKKEAIDMAKRQTDAHVVWLEIRVERDSPVSTDVTLQYSVFTPQTAKVKTFGRVYLDGAQLRKGGVGVGLPPSTARRLPLDYLMKEAGRSVAERLMSSFHISSPD
jgi:hypothetical protein